MDDEPAVGEPGARLVDAAEHAVEELARGAERLGVDDGARRLVERDEVREGAADVDADPEGHRCGSIGRGASGAATTSAPTRRERTGYFTITEVVAARQLLLLLDSTTTAVWSEHASRK